MWGLTGRVFGYAELGVKSPLRHAELTKEEIRAFPKILVCPHAEQSFACLASRIVYGERNTEEKLKMVDQGESLLLEKGFFAGGGVRIHGYIARISFPTDEFGRSWTADTRDHTRQTERAYGFSYVSLDLRGYRTGSRNETL
jgi:uncharacterized protein